jgi:hypothetical protein
MDDWSDAQTGRGVVIVIGGIGAMMVAMFLGILAYGATLGYHLYLP